jgi:UDP-glucose 4-epimerase
MQEILVTGASGFFGGVLKRRLLAEGFAVTNIDLVRDEDMDAALTSIQGDIRDAPLLERTRRCCGLAMWMGLGWWPRLRWRRV